MLIALTLASSLAYYSSWVISPFLFHEGWEDLRVFGVQLLHKSHRISAYWIFFMNNSGSKGRRTFVLLMELMGVTIVSGCAVLRESLLLFICQTLTKDVCRSQPDERTSRHEYVQIQGYLSQGILFSLPSFRDLRVSTMPNMWGM